VAPENDTHWIEIGYVVLQPEQRTGHLPDDTKSVPYYARTKGFVAGEVRVGDTVEVETLIGRRVTGEVLTLHPVYGHDFGEPIEELLQAGREARAILRPLLAKEVGA
jgi:2-amino-4-ketopentanoate thiolase alpha subunit